MSEHAELEALSAFVDGEAPEWAPHVETCAACRASVERLRAVSAAVGGPVGPPPAADRERAIAAALDGAPPRPGVAEHPRLAARRRRLSMPALAAVAAVVAGVVGLSVVVSMTTGTSENQTTLAGPTPAPAESDAAATAESGRAADTADGAELGDVPDAATLLARARPPSVSGPATLATPSGPEGGPAAALPPARNVVGTRPCEEQARAREPALREVVYFATARQGSVPAYVLGFSTGPAPAPVTLLLLAQNGCGELLRAVAP